MYFNPYNSKRNSGCSLSDFQWALYDSGDDPNKYRYRFYPDGDIDVTEIYLWDGLSFYWDESSKKIIYEERPVQK